MRVAVVVGSSVAFAAALLWACSPSNGTAPNDDLPDPGDASFPDSHGQTLGDATLTKDVSAKDAATAPDVHPGKDAGPRDAAPPRDAQGGSDAACLPLETDCTDTSQCCVGQCAQVGELVAKWCCSDTDGGCTRDLDCCGELLCANGGRCAVTCLPLQTPCNAPTDCCLGATCAQVGGLVQDWCCSPQDGGCTEDNDCCGSLRCTNQLCN
jgi:hypothetical protein